MGRSKGKNRAEHSPEGASATANRGREKNMTRAYIDLRDGSRDIPATGIEESGDFYHILNGEKLVGVFDKGVVSSITLTERGASDGTCPAAPGQ